jgi:hypothetical protein
MVDISERLHSIKNMVDNGAYFTVNRARQYGKTTTLMALQRYLEKEYTVIYMDFQFLSQSDFENENTFICAFSSELLTACQKANMPDDIKQNLSNTDTLNLRKLFSTLSNWCSVSSKPIVLIIDEVDSATNNQVFLDFLAQLRGYYIHRESRPTFQSVILAGVYDVKNMKQKIRNEQESKYNSPWNISTDFDVPMNLSPSGIKGMLMEYAADHDTDMDTDMISELIYEYTGGYPFLVSRICQLVDQKATVQHDSKKLWNKDTVLAAVKIILSEKNTLFDSLMSKLQDYPELKDILYSILFGGEKITYNPDNVSIDIAQMFGFISNSGGNIAISNRIFETRLYNYFLANNNGNDEQLPKFASANQGQFIKQGHLNMDLILEKFTECFGSIYGDNIEPFDESEGRRRFLLYLRPIINGTGNYYIEAETRNSRRMDIVVDYHGEQFIIELKIWRGNAYNERGEQQLTDYLEYFHINKGYMLSYNFNKNKQVGIKEIQIGDKMLIEAVV